MQYILPVALDAPDGKPILSSKQVDVPKDPPWTMPGIDLVELERSYGKTSIDIIVVAMGSLSAMEKCVGAVLDTLPSWANERILLLVDRPDDHVRKAVDKLARACEQMVVVKTTKKVTGRVAAMAHAASLSRSDLLAFVDSRTVPVQGWFERMVHALNVSGASMAVPYSSKQLPPMAGCGYVSTGIAVGATAPRKPEQIALPGDFFFMVRRKAFEDSGGFDVRGFNPGYGEVADLYMRLLKKSYHAVRAPAYVLDKTPGKAHFGEWLPEGIAGFMRFSSKWGEKAKEVIQKRQREDLTAVAKGMLWFQTTSKRDKVVFVLRDVHLCGLVLAIVNVCNELIEHGWEASFACTSLPPKHARHLSMNFSPYVFRSREEMVKSLSKELDDAFVVATIYPVVSDVLRLCDNKPSLKPIYFIQDDERQFKHSSGKPYHDKEAVEKSYDQIKRKIVNSSWVLEEVAGVVGGKEDLRQIGIGVDTDMFYPVDKPEDHAVIMAHCRPSTPRRGWTFVESVLVRVARSLDFELVTYDEDPGELPVKWHGHLGRVSSEELASHMRRVHVFVEGSQVQGWGMQGLEAMASGCALVTTDNRGIYEYGTPGHDCVVIPYGDVERAAAVICHLIAKKEEAEQFGANARKTAAGWRWSSIGDRWNEYLRRQIR